MTAGDDEQWAHDLAADLAVAHDAATDAAGSAPLGLRAIDSPPGRRWYLCAFEGPRFLCLDEQRRIEGSAVRVREVAAAGMLVEWAEGLIDSAELNYLAGAAGRLLAALDEPVELSEAIQEVAQRALELAAWRESPRRELASVVELDRAVALHAAFLAAYGRFVTASEPLVARQDDLEPELVSALRVFEEASGRAGVGEPLAARVGAAVDDCNEAADEVVAAYLRPLSSGLGGEAPVA